MRASDGIDYTIDMARDYLARGSDAMGALPAQPRPRRPRQTRRRTLIDSLATAAPLNTSLRPRTSRRDWSPFVVAETGATAVNETEAVVDVDDLRDALGWRTVVAAYESVVFDVTRPRTLISPEHVARIARAREGAAVEVRVVPRQRRRAATAMS